MAMQKSTYGLHLHHTDSADREFSFDAFVPVLMMSCIGLTLSLWIALVTG